MKLAKLQVALIFACSITCTAAYSENALIFTSPPRETSAAGAKLYGPLAAYLTTLLGQKVVYVHPNNWLAYQVDMRKNKYDIIFDGPHFASWRMVHLHNTVLVRLPGNLIFYLIAKKNNTKMNSLNDLVAHTFCGIAPPNLSTLSILAKFGNPVEQPIIHAVRGGMPAVMKAFNKGDCQAAVVRSDFFNKKMKPNVRAKYKIIYTVPPLPNQSITVSTRVSDRDKLLIREALTQGGKGVQYIKGIIKRFTANKAKAFIPANSAEFKGLNYLLQGVIFGW